MIYTVTLNPAIDYYLKTYDVKLGETNRSADEFLVFGGKGINVSVLLTRLGVDNVALGFIAGFTGDQLEKEVKSLGVKTDFIKCLNGLTRINVKLKSNEITEINANGPIVDKQALEELILKLSAVSSEETVVLSGSVPKSLSDDVYAKIVSMVNSKGAKAVVDASGKLLLNAIKEKPFLIKPNLSELEQLLGRQMDSTQHIIDAAKELKRMGAQNVIVSMGKDGALMVDEFDNVYRQTAKRIDAVNTVGAGDSMVAGFLSKLNHGYKKAFSFAVAAGSAAAASVDYPTKDAIELLNKED